MDENKSKFEMPDIDELAEKLDEPVEEKYELPEELKEEKSEIDSKINPSRAVGPNGESSTRQNADFMPNLPNYSGEEPGRAVAMRGMILSICSVVLALICNFFAGAPVAANIINIVALICGIGGIVFGVMGGNQNISYNMPRGAMSWTGIILGIIGILISGVSFACIAACAGIRQFLGM